MKVKMTWKKTVSGLLIGAVLLSAGGMVWANANNNDTIDVPNKRLAGFKGKGMMRGKGRGYTIIDKMIEKGILTQEELDQLCEEMQTERKAERQQYITEQLDTLVNSNTITQEQAEKINAYLQQQLKNRKIDSEKMKDMTPEERRQYMEAKRQERINLFDTLVEDGVITEDQAKIVARMLRFGK